MTNPTSRIAIINSNVKLAKSHGLLQRSVDEILGNGRTVVVDGNEMVNFGSCSYLGLETDPRLRDAAHAVIDNYGVHFSSSRSYLSLSPYEELEDLLGKMFSRPVIVTPSTTLGHMALMPLIIGSNDHVILDQQVHSSILFSVKQVRIDPKRVERVRHNRMDYLENRLKKLCSSNEKVWYLADGVYSMYGDTAPFDVLLEFLDRFENFHLYIDDAHGMSWAGENGAGLVSSKMPHHPRITLVTSLGKGFGTSGGAIICKDEQQKELVRNCGGTLIFSGPLQPANLGAAIASAKIHLSDELPVMQAALRQKVKYFKEKTQQLQLPLITVGETPIFYIGLGNHLISGPLCEKLMEEGFFTCISSFPTVPHLNTGLRILVNLHQSDEDTDRLLETIAHYLTPLLIKEGLSIDDIYSAFRIDYSIT